MRPSYRISGAQGRKIGAIGIFHALPPITVDDCPDATTAVEVARHEYSNTYEHVFMAQCTVVEVKP